MSRIVVIGGGIIGLSTAFYLNRYGHEVTVIDRNNFSDNCSYGNAGYVCPSHFVPLASPGVIGQGLKWMLDSKSPFFIQPSFNAALWQWLFRFMRSANARHVQTSARPLRDLSLLSMAEFQQWAEAVDFDFAYQHRGILEVFKTEKAAAHGREVVHSAADLGLDVVFADPEEVNRLEPEAQIQSAGAIHFRCDAHLDPGKLMTLLRRNLEQKGVMLAGHEEVQKMRRTGKKIAAVATDKSEYACDAVVVAAGAWSRTLGAMAGCNLPMMPGRGYSVTLDDSGLKLTRPVILAERRVAITPLDAQRMRFGGTMEIVPANTPPRYSRMKGILNAVKEYLPGASLNDPPANKIWYGYRPCSADGLPYIGRSKANENVVIATGHSMLGMSLGPGTGRLVANIIDERPLPINMAPFATDRFD